MFEKYKYKFTIIVPAYNAEETIDIPLKSLQEQTYNNFQVIIVDDGSTDSTVEKVKPYLIANNSWKLIKKQNGNWGSVINHVVENKHAAGEYVTILDADDYFKPNMLEEISKQSADVIVTDIFRLNGNKTKKVSVMFGKSGYRNPETCHTPLSMPHGKFYRRELFNSLNKLVEGVSYQDTVLYNELLSKARDVYYINKPLAIWWEDRVGNSTTVSWDEKRANLWIETCQRVVDIEGSNEVNSWALMYLWELRRQYKKPTSNKVDLNLALVGMKWLPFGTRFLAKLYFAMKTKRYRK